MAKIADTIVVGNHLYDNLTEALETVKAVHALSL
jgi:putative glycerol-1-phosphate prenyltransferase